MDAIPSTRPTLALMNLLLLSFICLLGERRLVATYFDVWQYPKGSTPSVMQLLGAHAHNVSMVLATFPPCTH